jgi:hypothetical protein
VDALTGLFNQLLGDLLKIAGVVAMFFLAWSGVLWMSAGGSPHQMEKAKQAAINTIVGFVIVLAARAVIGLFLSALGGV